MIWQIDNNREQEKAKKFHDSFEVKQELPKLMKRVIYATDNGEKKIILRQSILI